ncbi:MFS transporter [Streptomyces alkaliterrae]|uniref:MFS transporter n=1 Tax=Streptomyces alkaliterrae TaxID=2213162 RepID=A0A5P0Z0P5_9ACTN|nr:MFS transporter [Streptomyces alkaliterrae]MBB1262299.1 MFS transporter [Streptomyces alkaliterrae]MQS05169.1 MFS transporter [Streptomyces alkaliterrae]
MADARTGLVHDGRVLLRFRYFRRLLAVRLLSQLSDGVYQVALATYVVFSPEKQTSPAEIASAMAVLLLPYSVLGPFVGVLLDRWQRRQVLLLGNLLRAVLAVGTAALIAASAPTWLFYASALSVTAVNRFILAGLSASLPRVVDAERLVMANSVSPTAGTIAATVGGGLAIGVRLLAPEGGASDAAVVLLAAAIYLLGGLAALRLGRELLGPEPSFLQPRLAAAISDTVRGLWNGLGHLAQRPLAAKSLAAMTLLRFCYGALTVMVLMLCRYAWAEDVTEGMALLGLAVGVSGFGFFVAAVLTPLGARRFGRLGYMGLWAALAAVLLLPLGLPFRPGPMLVAAFLLGAATQSAKICTDTIVQAEVDDGYRGRVFSLYDMLYNVAFVSAAAVAALMLPPDGRSATLVVGVAALYAAIAWWIRRIGRARLAARAGS